MNCKLSQRFAKKQQRNKKQILCSATNGLFHSQAQWLWKIASKQMKKINCFSQVQELTLLLIDSLVEEIILNKAQHHSNKCDDIFFIHSMA